MSVRTVSVCIPAYQSEGFLEETLDSVLGQSWPDIEILISVDLSTDGTAALARRYAPRAKVLVQDRRLGWVKNHNVVLRAAKSRYVMIMPHDDVLEPEYVAKCMAALDENPEAVLAFSDLDIMGRPEQVVIQVGEVGDFFERMQSFLRGHFSAVAVRGIVDRQKARHSLVPEHAMGDFAADTLFVAQMAAQGQIIRVPEVLYHKRLHAGSTHAKWYSPDPWEIDEMWVAHCLEIYRTIGRVRPSALFDPRLRQAISERLARQRVEFVRRGWPEMIDPQARLLPQLLQHYWRIRRRRPHYSWLKAADSRG